MSESSDDSEGDGKEKEEKKEGQQRKKRVIREPNKFTPQHDVRVKKVG